MILPRKLEQASKGTALHNAVTSFKIDIV